MINGGESYQSALLDNALRYAPSGSKIELDWLGFGVGKLSVRDEGPGPKGRSLNQLVAQKERTDGHDGKRIGLRLVEAIALRHGGEVSVEDANPGLKVVMEFPLHGRRGDQEVPYMWPPR